MILIQPLSAFRDGDGFTFGDQRMLDDFSSLFLIMCIAFWIKLKQEESLLLLHFPSEYPAYQTRVQTLIPFLR